MSSTIALIVTIGFFAVLGFLGTVGIPDNATTKDVLLMLVGGLATQFGNIVNYYFGSSKGSSDKTAVIADQIKRSNEGD